MRSIGVLLLAIAATVTTGTALAGNGNGKLPPGLQKKVDRGGSLPPGWQRNLEVGHTLDKAVYQEGTVTAEDDGVVTISVDDRIVRVVEDTREILEILR
ncbi:MAG: hypothetical protein PVH31_07660 [Ectothiorhodospiraceae bacterium]|jgi:hypothetical protein